ncbi:hypothetical protein HAP48_0042575 [Bradyrhizobium septentrionale]|uniref:Uncharacterized protein n=1 Tax=Bradyrhizobium septentrionale TaxID=1404411 RepID=A0A973W2W4_9BRAD|nr:hypothetical protein [Bradyrhizobium septentrionale]UGY15145.1 hypothetical protein HAP48_0042575 [Bradyrhizobium septentrionale]UGY23751.1 hypothetical protein HU675_0038360 [Bradyrhizobium septentrionale]
MIKIIATLCSLAAPADCHEVTVTNSDFQPMTMTQCMVGLPAIAEWMKQHPAERLAGWKCQLGTREQKAA